MRKIKLSLSIAFLLMFCNPVWSQKAMEPSFSKSTTEADALFRQGIKLYDQGDVRLARKMFMQAAEKDPSFVSAIIYHANTAQTASEYVQQVNKAQAVIDKGSDWDKMMLQILQTALVDDYQNRVTIAEKMVSTFPNAFRAYIELGNAYTAGNQTQKARDVFMRATKLAPQSAAGYFALAGSYVFDEPKDFSMAEKYAQQAVQMAPTSSSIQILLGDVYRAQKNLEKARDAYTSAINLQKDGPEAYYKRGHANTYLGKFEDARTDYSAAGKYDETDGFANQNIAYTYLYDNDSKKAMQSLTGDEEKLVGSDPVINQARLNMLASAAVIALHNNDAGSLSTILTRFEPLAMQLATEIGTSEAKASEKASVLYWKSALQALQGNYAAAEQLASDIKSELQPINNPRKLENYSSLMGLIHYKQNKFNEAVDDFQKADRNNVYDKYWLARSYEAAGSKENATAIYKEIADNNFNSVGYALIRNEVKKKLAQ
jgi:tetratricopeptide (TPR) repeat protein